MWTKSPIITKPIGHMAILFTGATLALLLTLCWVEKSYAQGTPSVSPAAINNTYPIAGLSLQLEEPEQQPDGSVHAKRAKLIAPPAFGGASTMVNDVTVRNGVITIGGNIFDLPRISVAGFELGLEGKLQEGPNGEQLIGGSGIFAVPGLLKALPPCTGIGIGVTLASTPDGNGGVQTTLTIASLPDPAPASQVAAGAPYSPAYVQQLSLREAQLEFRCSIPIGTTGFLLKRIAGKITLEPERTVVEIEAGVATVAKVLPGVPVLEADGTFKLQSNPFELGLAGGLNLFKLPVASADARIWDKGFEGGLKVEIIVARGEVRVATWVDQELHMTGSGYLELGVERGVVVKGKCFKLFRKIPLLKKICTPPIPPFATPKARFEVQVGQFQNGAWGFAGTTKIAKWSVGVYIDAEGKRTFKDVDQYQLMQPPDSNSLVVAAGAVTFPMTIPVPVTYTSELVFTLSREGANPQLSLIMPDGTPVTPATLPANIAYTEYFTTTADEAEEIATTDIYYYVADAQPGEWQAVLSGEPGENELYLFEVIGNPDQPTVAAAESVVASNTRADVATITWQLTAYNPDTRVAIYANSDPITTTFVVTNDDGTTENLVLPNYGGIELADNVPTSEDNTEQSYEVDLSELESGKYSIWLEVDDGINDPVEVYLPDPLVVDHTDEWTAEWTPTITTTADYEDALIEWTPYPNADLDYYTVYVGETPGSATPEAAVDSFIVGDDEGFELFSLDGDTTYYLSIGAYDTGADEVVSTALGSDDRLTLSPEVAVTTKSVTFRLISPSDGPPLTLTQGGSVATALLVDTEIAEFPDEVYLYADCAAAPPPPTNQLFLPLINRGPGGVVAALTPAAVCQEGDGLSIGFDHDNVIPTQSGEFVNVTISASNTPPGSYTIPIVAESNNVSLTLALEVTVTAAQ